MEKVSARDDAYKDISIFTEVINKVREEYVEQPNMEKAMNGALHGMMEALDPYSSFVDRAVYQKIKETREQFTAQPGVILSKRYGYGYVVSVVPGSPADRAGLRTGDLVDSIDGKLTTLMSQLEAQTLMFGPAGSTLKLNLIRARGRSTPTPIELVREEPQSPEVTAKILEDGFGLLRISHFEKGAAESVLLNLKKLQSSNIRGLLVDVRGTAQGVLEEAVRVSGFFLPKGAKVVTSVDRNGKEAALFSSTDPVVSNIPVILLIDGGTSGMAEIFGAALQDHKVAEAVGEKTNGQGSSQDFFFLEDGAALFISTRIYHRVSGKPLQGQNLKNSGLMPDARSPSEDFVTNFYFDNTPEDMEKSLDEEFYQKLDEAIEKEQLNAALERARSKALKKAA